MKTNNIFTIVVDYCLTLEEMIIRGNYNCDSWILSFLIKSYGVFPVEIIGLRIKLISKLFIFDHFVSPSEIKEEMNKVGYRPATLAELLTLGEMYPELQRQFEIKATHKFVFLDDSTCFPVLYSELYERKLNVNCRELTNHSGNLDCRYLGIRIKR